MTIVSMRIAERLFRIAYLWAVLGIRRLSRKVSISSIVRGRIFTVGVTSKSTSAKTLLIPLRKRSTSRRSRSSFQGP